MTTRLSVNVNKVALLRNQRDYGVPSVAKAATTCIEAGAHGITVHPRPDQRHITTQDVFNLHELLQQHPQIEYNIEGNPFEGKYMELVRQVKPTQATLVPDTIAQRTSDHGWNMSADISRLKPIIAQLRDLQIRVSVFMDPDTDQIARAAQSGADRVELYTESYAAAFRAGDYHQVLEAYAAAAAAAADFAMGVNAGHDLNLQNLAIFCDHVPGVLEVSIGHELTADALWLGMAESVKAYLRALDVGD